jgi:hypothetical protein
MKFYMHPVSTACRPARLLIAENGITCDEETVDILQGAHCQEPQGIRARLGMRAPCSPIQ